MNRLFESVNSFFESDGLEKISEEFVPNSLNIYCPKCGSNEYYETDGAEYDDYQEVIYKCAKCGYEEKDEISFDSLEESDSSQATILDFEETGGGCLNYVGEVGDYNFVGEIDGVLEFFDKKFGITSWEAYSNIEDEAYSAYSDYTETGEYKGKYDTDIQGIYDFEQKYTEFKPEYVKAVAEALKSYADNNISNFVYSSLVYNEVNRLLGSIEESDTLVEAGSKMDPAKAYVTIYTNYYDGMGDFSDSYEYIASLADDCGIEFDEDSIDSFRELNSLANKVIAFIYNNHSDMFRDICSDLIDSIDVDYLADTLEHKQGVVECFNVLKDFVSDSSKVDEILSKLQSVNVDIRLIAQEFQRYFHDNYEPWTFLGTTTGPRVYNDLFECPTDYEVVSADYFNYADRPSDMLDHIGYGWKQTDNGVQADLIGFRHSSNGHVAVYDQPPVTYGYSTVVDNSNKEEKFKEMADTLTSKAKEIKSQYHLGK